MSDQLSLPGMDAAPASFQPEATHGCLHISRHAVASDERAIRWQVVDATRAAASSTTCPPVPALFDRACSFSNGSNPGKNGFVLGCDTRSDAAVARLRQTLALVLALRRMGLRPEASRAPHMTMLDDRHLVPEDPIEPTAGRARASP